MEGSHNFLRERDIGKVPGTLHNPPPEHGNTLSAVLDRAVTS